ncbi:MAG: ABC transporter ATP-binding protein [Streptosporangiaceae bacterium]
MPDAIVLARGATPRNPPAPILEAVHVTKHFPVHGGKSDGRFGDLHRRVVHAVDDASLGLYPGQVTALVGESGSGKSTLARILAGLYKRTSGEVLLRGQPVRTTHGRAFREHVGDVQLILQDPYGSFNPMLKVSTHLQRAVRIHDSGRGVAKTGAALRARTGELLEQVNLVPPRQFLEKYPHELSGGQLQRVSIARALAARPSVILADEPVSNLDVSIRLGVLNLLADLTSASGVALLYVTHDVASARYFASETAVMYAGELVESGPSEKVTGEPAHPYTRLLISSAPDPARRTGRTQVQDKGQPPSLISPPAGCRFHPRCPLAMPQCSTQPPPRFDLGGGHWSRCWLFESGGAPTGGTAG